MDIKELGEILKKIRESKGISQAELAKRTDVHERTIMRMEKGISGINTIHLLSILDEFEIDFKGILTKKLVTNL